MKGIEYDTLDAGHILIIMPQGVKMRLLELRGLPLSLLIDFVHHNGGICGPAHPCGEKYLSFTNTKRWQKSPELIEKFDFIETFNACEPPQSNEGAKYLAEKYGKPGTGGSDAHKLDCVGMGYTEFPVRIETELDLIRQIREKRYALRFRGKPGEKERYTGQILGVGISYDKDTKEHHCKIEQL